MNALFFENILDKAVLLPISAKLIINLFFLGWVILILLVIFKPEIQDFATLRGWKKYFIHLCGIKYLFFWKKTIQFFYACYISSDSNSGLSFILKNLSLFLILSEILLTILIGNLFFSANIKEKSFDFIAR